VPPPVREFAPYVGLTVLSADLDLQTPVFGAWACESGCSTRRPFVMTFNLLICALAVLACAACTVLLFRDCARDRKRFDLVVSCLEMDLRPWRHAAAFVAAALVKRKRALVERNASSHDRCRLRLAKTSYCQADQDGALYGLSVG